ncbi:hypothetical protein H9N25_11830 [Pedobacter riviphilus]|uniref:Uncharacterized protein n=1 Tax=Pedobacter riviphilus TaxID=2766984 RepID=A0ABX6TNA5_9SPHI|nr:hypothetical protein [Pedobacter riviphilus]QNR87014.1 hypothetical protein H9N25_11830 [Pedobacter riviphilus]
MNDVRLNELGFTGFIHLNPEKRDGLIRKVWGGLYKGSLITFRIKLIDNNWELDSIDCDIIDDSLSALFSDNKNINRVLDFISEIPR